MSAPDSPYRALVRLTGWLHDQGGQLQVNGVPLNGPLRDGTPWLGQRVTVTAWPRCDAAGQLRLRPRGVRAARTPNGTHFEVRARLRGIEPALGLLRVRLHPVTSGAKPFGLRIYAGPELIRRTDPAWSMVELRGGLLCPPGGGALLLAEDITDRRQ